MCKCFACLYVSVPHAWLVPVEVRRRTDVMDFHVIAGNQTCVLCKNSKCS